MTTPNSPLLLLKKFAQRRPTADSLRPIVSNISQEALKKFPQLQPYFDKHVQPYFQSHFQRVAYPATLPFNDKITRLNSQIAPEVFLEKIDHNSVIVWLNVPEKRNAMNFSMMKKLIMLLLIK